MMKTALILAMALVLSGTTLAKAFASHAITIQVQHVWEDRTQTDENGEWDPSKEGYLDKDGKSLLDQLNHEYNEELDFKVDGQPVTESGIQLDPEENKNTLMGTLGSPALSLDNRYGLSQLDVEGFCYEIVYGDDDEAKEAKATLLAAVERYNQDDGGADLDRIKELLDSLTEDNRGDVLEEITKVYRESDRYVEVSQYEFPNTEDVDGSDFDALANAVDDMLTAEGVTDEARDLIKEAVRTLTELGPLRREHP